MNIIRHLFPCKQRQDTLINRLEIENRCLCARVNQLMDDNIALVRDNMESEAVIVKLSEQNKLLEREINAHVDHIFHLKRSLRESGCLHPCRIGKRRIFRRAS